MMTRFIRNIHKKQWSKPRHRRGTNNCSNAPKLFLLNEYAFLETMHNDKDFSQKSYTCFECIEQSLLDYEVSISCLFLMSLLTSFFISLDPMPKNLKKCSLPTELAETELFNSARIQLSRMKSFNMASCADKLYTLMVCVRLPASFKTLQLVGCEIGISYAETWCILKDNPNYFYEIGTDLWATYFYADERGLIPVVKPGSSLRISQTEQPDEQMRRWSARTKKSGISCLSREDVVNTAHDFCDSQPQHERLNDRIVLHDFMNRLQGPAKTADLLYAAQKVLGIKIASSTFRKYLCNDREHYCSPAHGVWCTSSLAQERSFLDHRKNQQT